MKDMQEGIKVLRTKPDNLKRLSNEAIDSKRHKTIRSATCKHLGR
jgi:hypothetical protein